MTLQAVVKVCFYSIKLAVEGSSTHALSLLQAANAYGFRGTYQTEVIDAWDRSAGGAVVDGDANHIAWVKAASAAVIPYTSGRYVNRKRPIFSYETNVY